MNSFLIFAPRSENQLPPLRLWDRFEDLFAPLRICYDFVTRNRKIVSKQVNTVLKLLKFVELVNFYAKDGFRSISEDLF